MSSTAEKGAPMLEGLGDVAWEELSHACGEATDVPDLLRALLDPELCDGALVTLYGAICHQGTVYTASAPAVPFLVELARNPEVPDRSGILCLLASIGRKPPGSQDDWAVRHPTLQQDEDPDEARELLEWMAAVEATHTALVGTVPDLLGLLDDPEVWVRRTAVYALKQCRERAAEIVAALHRRLDDERDEMTRACAVCAAGELAGTGGLGLEPVRDWLTGLLDAPAAVRLAAGVAWAQASAEELPAPVLAAMTSALPASIAAYHGNVPWIDDNWPYWVEEGGLVGWVVEKLERQPASCTALVRDLATRGSDSELRRLAVGAAGELIADRRSPTGEIVAMFGTMLTDPDPEVRRVVLRQLIRVGPSASTVVDTLAAMAGHRTSRESAMALVALANCGDARCLPDVVELVNLQSLRLEALGPQAADALLATMRHLLTQPREPEATPPALSAIVEQFGRWGPGGAPAVPELVALLERSPAYGPEVCLALGRIGPAAAAAVPALRRAVEDPGVSVRAARALWRVTGDAATALRVLDGALDRPVSTLPESREAVMGLADLGPAAAGLAPRLRQRILDGWALCSKVHIAFALWRTTGDTQSALPVLLAWFGPLVDPTEQPTDDQVIEYLSELWEPDSLQVIEYLGEIGPPARAAVPMLRAILRSDRRVRFEFTKEERKSILVDERCQRVATTALDRILGRDG